MLSLAGTDVQAAVLEALSRLVKNPGKPGQKRSSQVLTLESEHPRHPERRLSMHWLFLVFAILFENAGTICMKLSHGFRNVLPSVLIPVFYLPGFFFLTMALKRIDVSVAYAAWSGLGTICVALVGILWLREGCSALRVLSICMIVAGTLGLNLSGAGSSIRG